METPAEALGTARQRRGERWGEGWSSGAFAVHYELRTILKPPNLCREPWGPPSKQPCPNVSGPALRTRQQVKYSQPRYFTTSLAKFGKNWKENNTGNISNCFPHCVNLATRSHKGQPASVPGALEVMVYMSLLLFWFPSHLGLPQSMVEFPVLNSKFSLVLYFT